MTLALMPNFPTLQVAAVPAGGWLLNSGAATAVGKMIIGAAKVKGIKTINLVRFAADLGPNLPCHELDLARDACKPALSVALLQAVTQTQTLMML